MLAFFFLLFLLALSALFSGSEAAIFSLSPSNLECIKKSNPRQYLRLKFFKNNINPTLITLLIGNLVVNIGASSFAAQLASAIFPEHGLDYSMVVMTFIIIIVGEITPKVYAIKYNLQLLRFSAPLVQFCYYSFYLFSQPLNYISRLFIKTNAPLRESYSSTELQKVLEISFQNGEINIWEKKLVSRILEMENMRLSELMIPRMKVIGLDLSLKPISYVWEIYRNHRIQKIPVFHDNLENIEGILYIKTIIGLSETELNRNYHKYLRKPVYMPESKRVIKALREFQQTQRYFALVFDEYGSVSGIVTLNHILTSFMDKYIPNIDETFYQKIGPNTLLVKGDLTLSAFNHLFECNLQDDYYESIGGYLLNCLGHIPKKEETIIRDGIRFTVLDADSTRILKIRAKKQ